MSDVVGGGRILVLVTGSGRSGTSSLAGSLAKLGLHVPLPVMPPNESNPKGYFETAWVVRFHNELLRRAIVRASDGSPLAVERVEEVLSDGRAAQQLGGWLAEQTEQRILVKDNQACWFLELWRTTATQAGLDLRVLTSLRHPAEVVGSRDRVWGQGRDDAERRQREASNVAAWLHGALVTEASARTGTRAFTGYLDLMTDWRAALGSVAEQLDLGLTLPDTGQSHELDEWLDPGLQHSRLTWEDIAVPEPLQRLAERAWVAVSTLKGSPYDAGAIAELDEVRGEYGVLYESSAAIVADHGRFLARAAARKNAEKLRARRKARQPMDQDVAADAGADAAGRRGWRRRPR